MRDLICSKWDNWGTQFAQLKIRGQKSYNRTNWMTKSAIKPFIKLIS